ncbi:MAG: hypothetical protein RMX68_024675 [Aulosira sp. ZfuVER01]|nr:hypothetical protein [Aulosira sp. DedVER01a]MDZ8054691.1 hypothetical protein [Aulosira sp. ZfuCHP01]
MRSGEAVRWTGSPTCSLKAFPKGSNCRFSMWKNTTVLVPLRGFIELEVVSAAALEDFV